MPTPFEPEQLRRVESLDAAIAREAAIGRQIEATRQGIPSRVDPDMSIGSGRTIGDIRSASRAPIGTEQRRLEQDWIDAVVNTRNQQRLQDARRNLDEWHSRPFGYDPQRQIELLKQNTLRDIQAQNQRRLQSPERSAGGTASNNRPAASTPSNQRPIGSTPRPATPFAPAPPAGQRNSPTALAPSRPIFPPRPPVSSPNNHPSTQTPNTSGARAPLSARDIPRQARPSNWQQGSGAGTPANTIPGSRWSTPRSSPQQPPSRFPQSPGRPLAGGGIGASAGIGAGLSIAMGSPVGGAIGGAIGGALGAAGGAALTPFAPWVGGTLGGLAGSYLGGNLGNGLQNLFFPSPAIPGDFVNPPVLGPYPFRGGQHDGIKYNYSIVVLSYVNGGAERTGNYGGTVWGPIGGVSFVPSSASSYALMIYSRGSGSKGLKQPDLYGFGTVSSPDGDPRILSQNYSRVDGQPDTAGNPERLPVTPTPPNLLTRAHPANTPYTPYFPNPVPLTPHPVGPQQKPGVVPSGHPGASNQPRPESPGMQLPETVPNPTPVPTPNTRPRPAPSPSSSPGSSSSPGAGGQGAPASPEQEQPQPAPDFGLETQRFTFPLGGFAVPFAVMRTNRAANTPTADRAPVPTTQPGPNQPPPDSPSSPCRGNSCGTAIRHDIDLNRQRMGDMAGQLAAMQNLLNNALNLQQVSDLSELNAKLDRIDSKLGPQIPNGGISGFVQQMQNYAQRAWKATRMDKVLNALTFLTVLHNASMLSRELGETLFELISYWLNRILPTDEENSPIDVGEIVGDTIENWIKGILGEEVYEDLSIRWKKASRIYQAGANIIWTIRSIQNSAQEVAEWTAENTGRIGNALKRWGVVGERAYPWMAERVKSQEKWRRRMQRVFDGLETAEDRLSSFYGVSTEVGETIDEVTELGENSSRFKESVIDYLEDEEPQSPPPDFVPIGTEAQEAQEEALAPVIKPPDLERSPTQPTPEEMEQYDNA